MQPDSDGSDPHLLEIIRAELRARGALTFARYIELALYHPEHGYYGAAGPRIGPGGDYYTSADVSPLFGAAIGRQLHEMWETLGRPDPFTVLEYGAGKGTLAADILGWAGAAHPDFFAATAYLVRELSPGLRAYQRGALRRLPVRWIEPGDLRHGSLTGCVLSNEVADALPFHRVRVSGGALRELWVATAGEGLVEREGEPSTPALQAALDADGVVLADGRTAEINLRAPAWMAEQIALLDRGYALTIDYGDIAPELYGPRRANGTLACYYRHTRNAEPFERVGRQDITAHVNFTALGRAVRAAGGQVAGYTTQGFFLASLGLGEALVARQAGTEDTRAWERERAAVEQLIRPDGLGGFRVLIARKGIEPHPLRALALGAQPLP